MAIPEASTTMPTTSGDSIRLLCPKLGCQRVLSVPAAARGLVVRCCGCGSKLRIPKSSPPAALVQPMAPTGTAQPRDVARRDAA